VAELVSCFIARVVQKGLAWGILNAYQHCNDVADVPESASWRQGADGIDMMLGRAWMVICMSE
jgi:hypothetical protein